MFLFSLGFASSLILSLFALEVFASFISYIVHFPIFFGLDRGTIAVWLVSLNLIVLNVPYKTVAFAAAFLNKLESSGAMLIFSLMVSELC